MKGTKRQRRQSNSERQAAKIRAAKWSPGMPLTEREHELLKPLLEKASELGRTPKVKEVPESGKIKTHFRLWKHALAAAGLPPLSEPAQMMMRSMEAERTRCEKALQSAQAEGFEAAIVDTADIVFDSDFRKYCAENLCGEYGTNHSCPPACGSPEKMRMRVTSYRKALFVRSQWDIPDWNDRVAVRDAQRRHNEAMQRLMKIMDHSKYRGYMCGASCCAICDVCAQKTGEPCRYPDRMYSCLSAYCINVQKLAESAQMDYLWGGNQMSLYGIILIGGFTK